MPDYVLRIEFKVVEEYEFEVRAPDEAKATKAILEHVKNIANIDPWKVRKFDVQETSIVSIKDKRDVPTVESGKAPVTKNKRKSKSSKTA